ncbi:MAG: sodium/proline symporter PutP [Cellulosilyticum sp.]|nr:sodium/proline symporter PutP [Cellulosilyticum sp.]
MDKSTVILLTFCVYLLGMLAIGGYFYFKTKNLEDYLLGGRNLGKWVTSISAQASDMSGWLLMGLPGLAYLSGISNAAWTAIGLAVGTYLNWKIVAKKLRIYTEKCDNAITLSSYFEKRFNDDKKILSITSALFILVFFIFYVASSFVSSGKLLNNVFHIDYEKAVFIGASIIIIYTFLGGFLAVCWTDLIQGILMFIAILALPLFMIITHKDMISFDLDILNSAKETIATTGYTSLWSIEGLAGAGATVGAAIISVISALAWGMGYFGQPHILTRFMAIHEPEEINRSRIIAMGWVIISLIGAIVIGLVGRSLTNGALISDPEHIFIEMVMNYTPTFLCGILLSAILAAVMSTADSQLLVTASAISEDLYKGFIRKNASDKELVWVSRATIILVAIMGYYIAMNPENESVLALVAYAWAGFGATFGPVVIMSLFYKKTTRLAAICGMIAGGVITIIWPKLLEMFPDIDLFKVYEIVPGFIFATIVIVMISAWDQKGREEMLAKIKEIELN